MVWVDSADGSHECVKLAAMRSDKGEFFSELMEVHPFEWLKERFPVWDGTMDWLDSAYPKFVVPDPRPLILELKDLSDQERKANLKDPLGAPESLGGSESSKLSKLLASGQRTQASLDELRVKLGAGTRHEQRKHLDDGSESEGTSNSKQSPLKPRELKVTPINPSSARARKRPKLFEPGADQLFKKQHAHQTPKSVGTEQKPGKLKLNEIPVSPGKRKLENELLKAKAHAANFRSR